ncbi:MAG: ABC transporter permease [Nitrospinaceae bacterium]
MKTGRLPLSKILFLILAECKGAWNRFIFFLICITLGVGAVMTIKSFAGLLDRAIHKESKSLLAADIAIQGSWEQNPKDIEFEKQALPPGTDFLFIKELHAMARHGNSGTSEGPSGASLLVELKAIPLFPPHYPLYGKLETRPQRPIQELLSGRGAVVEPSFLLRTDLKVGDRFHLGRVRVRITGTVLSEPDRISRAFSIGPRVFLSRHTLEEARLILPGSRVKHRTLIRLPPAASVEKAASVLKKGLSDKSVRLRTYKDMQSALTASIQRIGQYLGALGVIALILGGIGVAMIIRTFMTQKLDTIAILNCLGASSRTLFNIYLLQSLLLGMLGSLLGVALGYGMQYLLPSKLVGLLNIQVRPEFSWVPAAQSLSLGLVTTLLFCVWPLTRAVRTRPLRLFRRNFEEEELSRGSRRERWAMGFSFLVILSLIVVWQAGSVKRSAVFLLALGIAVLILRTASLLMLRFLKKMPPSQSMTWRYGLSNLFRPNNQAVSIITCLGLGIMLVLTVRLVQMDMIAMLQSNTETTPPNYFFIDIQPDQADRFVEIVDRVAPGAERELVPLVRSRFYSADGRKAREWKFTNRQEEEWFIHRTFVLTYMTRPPPRDNIIVKGKWWSLEQASIPQVSLEEDAARRLGVSIGSRITMDIQGILVTAAVTNIRRVNWKNMRTNFYMIFSPGALQSAPITFVATVHVPRDQELKLQQAVVKALPNITALSTRDIVNTVQTVVNKLKTLVDFMSVFSIAAGGFILFGSVASTRFRRLKESAILKILGARRKTVAGILGVEYATLGTIAGILGAGLSLALSWAIMKFLVKSSGHLYPGVMAWTLVLTILFTTLLGVASSWDVLRQKPFKTLRKLDG